MFLVMFMIPSEMDSLSSVSPPTPSRTMARNAPFLVVRKEVLQANAEHEGDA